MATQDHAHDPTGSGVMPNTPTVGFSTVWYGTSHKINLGNYSNVDVGPAGCQIVVQAGNEEAGLNYAIQVTEKVMDAQRDIAVDKAKAAKGML